MRKLIRCKRTKAFLTPQGTWTHQVLKAADFPDFLAHAAIRKFQLTDVELYYSFNERATSRFDFTIPLAIVAHNPRNFL